MKKDFFTHLTDLATSNNHIPAIDYDRYDIKRGLRNANGTGVLVGLTEIGNVDGYDIVDGVKIPKEGRLYYRGIDLFDLVDGFQTERRRGFEETTFLLLFGKLPTEEELETFKRLLDERRDLPEGFTDSMIISIPSKNVMNKLQRSTLVLYSYDDNPDDLSMENLLRQSLSLIARFPTIIAYGYQAKARAFDGKSLYIHSPQTECRRSRKHSAHDSARQWLHGAGSGNPGSPAGHYGRTRRRQQLNLRHPCGCFHRHGHLFRRGNPRSAHSRAPSTAGLT